MPFLLGLFTGVAAVFTTGYLMLRGDRKKLKKELDAIKSKQLTEKQYESVRPRLKKAAEISNKQLELYMQTQEPSKNSLHSKWKNDLIYQIKELEKEKRTVLRSIIKDGLDPELELKDEKTGQKYQTKLSEYMLKNGMSLTEENDKLPDEGPEGSRPTKSGKFFVIDGGKNDITH